MAVNGIGSYGIAGPSRKRTRGLQDYQQEVQAGNNINAYNGMGARSDYQRGLRSTAGHAIGGGGLQQNWRNQPEYSGMYGGLVAASKANAPNGPDPRYPVQQDFGQARKPMPIPGTTAMGRAGQNLGRGLMSMGGPVDADTEHPRYTEGNVLNSGTRVSYDADRNSMRLTGPALSDEQRAKFASGIATARNRQGLRDQFAADNRVVANAHRYGLPMNLPRVQLAMARTRSMLQGGQPALNTEITGLQNSEDELKMQRQMARDKAMATHQSQLEMQKAAGEALSKHMLNAVENGKTGWWQNLWSNFGYPTTQDKINELQRMVSPQGGTPPTSSTPQSVAPQAPGLPPLGEFRRPPFGGGPLGGSRQRQVEPDPQAMNSNVAAHAPDDLDREIRSVVLPDRKPEEMASLQNFAPNETFNRQLTQMIIDLVNKHNNGSFLNMPPELNSRIAALRSKFLPPGEPDSVKEKINQLLSAAKGDPKKEAEFRRMISLGRVQ